MPIPLPPTDFSRRLRPLAAMAAGAAALLLAAPGRAATAIVIGDSIGVGVSMAGGAPRLAHNSVAIRGKDALAQLHRVPHDAVAILSLGTNDAVGSIAGVERGVEKIVAAAEDAGVRLVWLGPPCVSKPWNKNVVKLDQILASRLAGRAAYVSVADDSICDKSLRAGDGVHFNMRGYSLLWTRAREAAGLPAEAAPGPAVAQARKPAHKRRHLARAADHAELAARQATETPGKRHDLEH